MSRRFFAPVPVFVVALLTLVQLVVVPVALRTATHARAATTPGQIGLRVESARTVNATDPSSIKKGDPVTTYKWLITADDTGNVNDPASLCVPERGTGAPAGSYNPDTCQWPSTRYTPGNVAVVAEGDQADFAPDSNGNSTLFYSLDPGKYLISVTANGYKIDGAHFTVAGGDSQQVVVSMQPYPLPLGTLRLRVFQDTAPVDGTYEVGVEKPLAGFTTHLNDVLGEVTTDFYGNRLCTNYVHVTANDAAPGGQYAGQKVGGVAFDASGVPVVDTANPGGKCLSDANGDVVIPNIGPDRYTATVVAPTGEKWYQTTTLEGNHDWDMWIAEGESGFDTEMTVGGEPVPPVDMGFVPYAPYGSGGRDQAPKPLTGTGTINGQAVEVNTYVGGTGGVTVPNAGVAGGSIRGPVADPIVALSDLGNNDQMVWIGRGGADGHYTIPNVPDGSYQLTLWDYPQDLIIDSFNVTVANGETVNLGQTGLVDWYTDIKGTVFIDTNGNGRRDPGEVGVPKFLVAFKERDNSLLDAGQSSATTDDQGNYDIREAYPLSRWSVLEAFNTRFKTTGITVQADNEKTPTTYLGSAVDISVLPVIGLSGRVDWGVQAYAGGENGGIVGTVTYDTTRNELDAAASVTEAYQPGIPGLTMHLYAPARDAVTGEILHTADGSVELYPGPDGKPLDLTTPYTTETWQQPRGCTAYDHAGQPLTDQQALPAFGPAANQLCSEAPMMGWQAVPSAYDLSPDGQRTNFSQTVNGNYGFGDTRYVPDPNGSTTTDGQGHTILAMVPAAGGDQPLPNDDYVVKVDIPKLPNGQPLYQVTKEEDVNIFDGDVRLPQENFPASTSTPTPVPGSNGGGGTVSQQPGILSECAGALHLVHVTDPAFLAGGGSPYENQQKPLCDAKLVTVRGGQSVAPNFNLFTPVPLPTHFWGLTINDLGLSQDKTQIGYGEAQPLPGVPMGIYDWSGRLVDTVTTDYNGMYEATEPSTSSYNCPLPAGPCPGMYYFKGNDPGQPGHANPNYNPRFRTIGTNFQAWPGLFTATDTAPTQVGVISVAPGTAQIRPVVCDVSGDTPQLMAVSQPYMTSTVQGQVPHASQVNQVTSFRIQGSGATRTATLTLATPPVVDPSAVGQAVTVAIGTGGTAAQRTALNGVHTITARTNTTVQFTIASATNTAGTSATGSATIAAYTASGPVPNTAQQITVQGSGFGSNPTVTLTPAGSSAPVQQTVAAGATDTALTFTVSTGTAAGPTPGVYQLSITNANGKSAVNGLTFHILGGDYTPRLIQVNPPAAFATQSTAADTFRTPNGFTLDPNVPSGVETVVQDALDRAAQFNQALVVVWPNTTATNNPTGDYFENLVMHSPVKIQGVGPGGFQGTTYVPGTRLNGLGFNPDNAQGAAWVAKVASISYQGPADVPDSAVVTVLSTGNFHAGFKAAIDGVTVTGGSVADFPTALGAIYGGTQTPAGAPASLVSQGGGIYVHASADNLQITDNVIVGNGGSYGGGIRVGTAYDPNFGTRAAIHNNDLVIAHNRIRDNGGTNLAGGVAIFDGTARYSIDHNDLCGNFSAEYGGGISQYGLSDGGRITSNRIYLNQSYDEGGGVMIAGELNSNLSLPSNGAGRVTIDANLVQDNLANDDGGGLRFLQATTPSHLSWRITVTNNIVTDNISAHEGGGLALDDSTNLDVVGNTVMKNVTTATAVTSNGLPAPAGLSTGSNSDQLQAALPRGTAGNPTPLYSKPLLVNNIFSDNRAGTWDASTSTVTGIGVTGANVWDLGSVEPLSAHYGSAGTVVASQLTPTYSLLTKADPQVAADPSNKIGLDPMVVSAYDVGVQIQASRLFPTFRQAVIVANAVAPDLQGNYHLSGPASPASNAGTALLDGTGTLPWPYDHDIDGDLRSLTTPDVGADEIP